MKEILKSEFINIIEETRLLLNNNSEWQERYKGYGEKISDNLPIIRSVRSSFHEWAKLKVYLNVTSAKKARNSVRFELRYMGQTVAKLTVKKDKGHKLSTKEYDNINERDFGCGICLLNANWRGEDAKKFRRFFKNRIGDRNDGTKKGNDEHRLESLLLTEFSKTKDKVIRNIKPVMIGGVRFPMPSPISASNHTKVSYSGKYGGGIDILSRTGTGGKATHLCIMELKDENEKRELPKDTIKQAIAYATFIRELLHSNTREIWWELFGFKGNIPERLELYAACVMPSNKNDDYSFSNMELNIEKDIIKLHYLYFTEGNGKIKLVDTSLPIKQ